MEREKLKLTEKEARSIIYDDHEDFEIIENKISGNGRWSIHYDIVVKRISDGKFFTSTYSEGATESQDERPYEYDEPVFNEVFKTEKMITVYE